MAVASLALMALSAPGLARTPPMGWMSWELFRCDVDCAAHPTACINEALYKAQTDELVSGGFLAAGYDTIHIDDCWPNKGGRDAQGNLAANASRFPSGMKALGDYMHAKRVKFGLYTAESPKTCAGYPASADHEARDAKQFAEWGVDYLKVDGCGSVSYYNTGYPAMGRALEQSGRDIVYSCSWPAYLGHNESTKPYREMIGIGCNLWRNYNDIQCRWSSLGDIIEHWGQWGPVLARYAGVGHWNDPDMLLIGNDCITLDEAKSQMAIWSIVAAPLIMGNDLRKLAAGAREVLLNAEAIAVNQDAAGKQGLRVAITSNKGEVWVRELAPGKGFAFALYNPTATAQKISVHLPSIGVAPSGTAAVRDLWAHKDLGRFADFSAVIPSHGSGFYTAQ